LLGRVGNRAERAALLLGGGHAGKIVSKSFRKWAAGGKGGGGRRKKIQKIREESKSLKVPRDSGYQIEANWSIGID